MDENNSTEVCVVTAITNLVAIVPFLEAIKQKRKIEAFLIAFAATASFFHHLTSTSHDLTPPFGEYVSTPLLWFDRIGAAVLIFYIFLRIVNSKTNLLILVKKTGFLLAPAIMGLFISDVLLHHAPTNAFRNLYCWSHSAWHVFAFLLVKYIQHILAK